MSSLPNKPGLYFAFYKGKLSTLEKIHAIDMYRGTLDYQVLKVFSGGMMVCPTTKVGLNQLTGWEFKEVDELGRLLYE
jgi:hypothetical protein